MRIRHPGSQVAYRWPSAALADPHARITEAVGDELTKGRGRAARRPHPAAPIVERLAGRSRAVAELAAKLRSADHQ